MLWSGALGKDKNRFIFSARFAAALALSACSASSQHRARLRKITRSKKTKTSVVDKCVSLSLLPISFIILIDSVCHG